MKGTHQSAPESCPSGPAWSLADFDYEGIDASLARNDEVLFYLVTAASFIEIGTDLYTRNLVTFFAGDEEATAWLLDHWEPEELQHGLALKTYVQRLWPAFTWEAAHANFLREYSALCQVDELEATRALELVARCMVEMGTSTYYSAIRDYAREPLVKALAERIRRDEVGHYKHFYRFFRRYSRQEGLSRLAVLGAIRRRVWELRQSDGSCALWHVFHQLHPTERREGPAFRALTSRIAHALRKTYPTNMAVKMTLRPLDLPPFAQAVVQPVAQVTQRWLLR